MAATLWCSHLNRTNCHNLAGKANVSVIIWIDEIRNSPQIIKVGNLNSDLAAGILRLQSCNGHAGIKCVFKTPSHKFE